METGKLLTLAAAIALLGSAGLATAQSIGTAVPSAPTTSTTSVAPRPATSSTVSGKLADRFSDFAGSSENSAALVNGLRTGSSITLSSPPPISAPGAKPPPAPIAGTTTFTPPTRPMGYGNVRIALSLARAELASQGISNPTPQQLQGALVGSGTLANGTSTQTPGILQMRADGMGWGKIANTMGFKLGTVMSGKTPVGVHTTQVTSGSGGTTGGRSSQVVTGASGASSGLHGSKGIVTGSGASAGGHGGAMSGGMGHGSARGGVITGAGGAGHGNSAGGAGKH